MTEKELHRLHRQDLLALLVEQGKEMVQVKQELEKTQGELEDLQVNYEKLRKRLDMKDEKIHKLRGELAEMATERRIRLTEAGSIAEAALRLNGIFEAAQEAADQYLFNIQKMQEEIAQGTFTTDDPSFGEFSEQDSEDSEEEGQKKASEDRAEGSDAVS